jgi:extradiol dioxygenase family protein
MSLPRFHLAFPVTDLEAARKFYVEALGCRIGRESERWIDFDFFGHQLTAHLSSARPQPVEANPVDGKDVPLRHFGIILDWDAWHALADTLKRADVTFVIEPYIRFRGEVGEQATMFIRDPSGNHLEFKSFKDMNSVFAR